jgi:uncharacterized protein
MSESKPNFGVVIARQQSLVLSTPGSLLAQLTSDVLPIAHQVRISDERSAQPIYEQGVESERDLEYGAALKSYLEAASLGHEAAQYRVGEIFLDGFEGIEKNYSEAYNWFHRAAEQGNSDALNRLGWMCEAGLGVARDQSRAVNWFRQAAERGHLEAQFNLGAKYDNGEGVAQNHAEATRWYRLSAEQGFTDARFFLAQALENGEGIPKNIQEAIDWYILATEDGHKSARLKLWTLAIDGEFRPEDVDEEILVERIGADLGIPLALFKLGYRYDLGVGLIQDRDKAKRCYELSAEKGFSPAISHLRIWEEYGRGALDFTKSESVGDSALKRAIAKLRGYKEPAIDSGPVDSGPLAVKEQSLEPLWMYLEGGDVDIDEVTYFREAHVKADCGESDSMSIVAMSYYFGEVVRRDFESALKWAERGAEAGVAYCHYLFGHMKLYGKATSVDKALALSHLLKAAKGGVKHAKSMAADLLLEVDDKKSICISHAIKMLKELAESGDESAQFELGYLYSNGQKVRKSQKLAVRYYRMSADQGNSSALFNLALKYEYGRGVEKDIATALSLYRGAAENGLVMACEVMAKFYAEGEFVAKDLKEVDRWMKLAEQHKAKAESEDANQITNKLLGASSNARRRRLEEKRSLKVKDQKGLKLTRN